MTLLTPESARELRVIRDDDRCPIGQRFVRDDRAIYVQPFGVPFETHAEFAVINGVGTLIRVGELFKQEVKDAGQVGSNRDGQVVFWGDSSSCVVKGDPDEAREETYKLSRRLGITTAD